MLCSLSFIFSKLYQLYCSRDNARCWYSAVDFADPMSRYTRRMLDLEDSQLRSTPLPSTAVATLLLREVRRSYTARSEVFYHDISLGDDEKVLIWDVVTRKRKYLLEDSGRRWGQITCLSWLGSGGRQDNGLAILCFGTARGLVVIYRQSQTDVGAVFTCIHPLNHPIRAQWLSFRQAESLMLAILSRRLSTTYRNVD